MKPLSVRMTEAMVGKATYPYHDIDDNMDEWVKKAIEAARTPFIHVVPVLNEKNYAGWKFTITGDTVEDAIYLYDNLGKYLRKINQPFKIGTKKLITSASSEQKHKLLTIYVMKDTKVDYLLSDIKYYLKNYKCKAHLKWSEHVEGAIWKRVDRDEYGNYIPADPSKGPMMVK